MPERIQLRRTKGWRKPEGAVVVSRPSAWGNPLSIHQCVNPHCRNDGGVKHWHYYDPDDGAFSLSFDTKEAAAAEAVEQYRNRIDDNDDGFYGYIPSPDEIRTELSGRDLCCWCPLDQPCHADVLLEIANDSAADLGLGAAARDGYLDCGCVPPGSLNEPGRHFCGRYNPPLPHCTDCHRPLPHNEAETRACAADLGLGVSG